MEIHRQTAVAAWTTGSEQWAAVIREEGGGYVESLPEPLERERMKMKVLLKMVASGRLGIATEGERRMYEFPRKTRATSHRIRRKKWRNY